VSARAFFARHWFLAGMAIAIAMGVLAPAGGRVLREAGWVMPALVAATLLVSGFTLDTSRLATQAGNVRAIIVALSSTYLIAPVAAYGLARVFGPSPGGPDSDGARFLEATMIAAAQAGTLASALALTAVARGDQELALVLTVLSNALTALLTPLALELSIGRQVEFPLAEMMARMALVVLLPVVAGQFLRRVLWSHTRRAMPVVRVVPRAIILAFLYSGFSAAASRLGDAPLVALAFLGAAASLHLVLLAFTSGVSAWLGFDVRTRAAVVLCGSQKTLPNGIYLWEQYFAANPWGAVPLVLYHVLQLLVDSLLAPWLGRRRDADDADDADDGDDGDEDANDEDSARRARARRGT